MAIPNPIRQQGKIQAQQANSAKASEIVSGQFSTVPNIPKKAANDNGRPTQQNIDRRTGQVDNSNVVRGAFGTSLRPAENPLALDPDVILPKKVEELLENYSNLPSKRTSPDDLGDYPMEVDGANGNPPDVDQGAYTQALQEEQINQEIQTQNLLDEISRQNAEEEEANQEQPREVKTASAPIFMFVLVMVEWILSCTGMFIAAFCAVTLYLLPVAGVIAVGIYTWKVAFNSFVFFWSFLYEKSQTGSIQANSKNKKKVDDMVKKLRLIKRLGVKGTYFAIGLAPLVDVLFPWNLGIVYSAWRSAAKTLRENQ